MDGALAQIEALAAKLNVGTDVLFDALVRQAPLYGKVVCVRWCVIYGLIVGVGFLLWAWAKQRDEDECAGATLIAACVVFLFYTVCVLSCDLERVVAAFTNPEMWAYMRLIRQWKED